MKALQICGAGLALLAAPLLIMARPVGVDVSNNDGGVNWTSIRGGGYTFAWAKATEGTTFHDSYYPGNMSNGKAAGVLMGAYDFARPAGNCPGSEANYFWSY